MKQAEMVKTAIYVGIVIAGALLAYSIYTTFFENSKVSNTPANYEKAFESENKENICETPEGYTPEQWKEHMSHHPDRYKECL